MPWQNAEVINSRQPLDNEISVAVIGGIMDVLDEFKQSGQPIDFEAVMRGLTTAYTMFALRHDTPVAIAALASMTQLLERSMADPAAATQPLQG